MLSPRHRPAIPLTTGVTRARFTGLGSAYDVDGVDGILTAETVSIDARGNQTVSRSRQGP